MNDISVHGSLLNMCVGIERGGNLRLTAVPVKLNKKSTVNLISEA